MRNLGGSPNAQQAPSVVMWHNGAMEKMSAIPKNPFRKEFYVCEDGAPAMVLSGELGLKLSWLLAPNLTQTRQFLMDFRGPLCWSRAALASFLGVSRETLRRWET